MQPVGKAVEGPVLLGIRFIEDPVDRDGDPANDGATALQLRGVGNGSQICPGGQPGGQQPQCQKEMPHTRGTAGWRWINRPGRDGPHRFMRILANPL